MPVVIFQWLVGLGVFGAAVLAVALLIWLMVSEVGQFIMMMIMTTLVICCAGYGLTVGLTSLGRDIIDHSVTSASDKK